MKYHLITLLALVILSCENNHSGKCVNVKVVKELCGQAVLQILDPEYFDHGQTWVDGQGVQYENVFLTILPCSYTDSGTPDIKKELYIQFTDSSTDNTCARCYALLDGPEKFSFITTQNCGVPENL